jgi:FkbM family methyltransferase
VIIPNNTSIKGIIQIGANDGNEINSFSHHTNNILCFEPVDESRNKCIDISKSCTKSNIIISDYIVSDKTGEVDFYIGQASGNSSMFDLNPERPPFHQWNKHEKKVKKKSITLDDFFEQNNNIKISDYNYIYMDVQGAEHLVLNGATKSLNHIDCIWMEVSYFEIYFNTMLFDEITKLCDSLGYKLYYHLESTSNQNQGDALYIKKGIL